jgi:hypothetical protein
VILRQYFLEIDQTSLELSPQSSALHAVFFHQVILRHLVFCSKCILVKIHRLRCSIYHQMWSNSTKTPWYRVLSIYGRFSSFQFLSLILIFFLHESIFTSLNIRTLKLTYYMMIIDCSHSAASKGYRYSNFLIRSSKFAK